MSSQKLEAQAEQAPAVLTVSNDSTTKGTVQRRGGGRGSKNRRSENRRANNNNADQLKIEGIERSSLSAPLGIKWKPAFGLYAGSVGIGTQGYMWFVHALTVRLKSIAQRPLAILLTQQNVDVYRKVALYLLHVKLCCAQDDAQVAVSGLTLRGTLSEQDKRLALGMSRSLPRALSYALSTFGYFKIDNQIIVPTLPPPTSWSATLNAADFTSLVNYVASHIHADIPTGVRAVVAALSEVLPTFTTANNRFTAATAAFWLAVTDQDWEVFREINAAARAQQLNVEDFNISAATGQPAQIIRFDTISEPTTMARFYSTRPVEDAELARALAIRPGDDSAAPTAGNTNRFRQSFDVAVLRGYDLPASAIEAVLQSLLVRESPF